MRLFIQRELIKEKEIQVEGLSQKAYGILLDNTRSCADVWVSRDDGKKLIRYREATLDKELDSLGIGRNPKSKKVEGEGLGWFTEEEVHHLWLRPEDRTALMQYFQT